ncbi:hypothetical protein PO909_021032 [Leuciscus waleckii]
MNHTEGGWSKNIGPGDSNATGRFRKKVQREMRYEEELTEMIDLLEGCLKQNKAGILTESFQAERAMRKLELSRQQEASERTIDEFSDLNEDMRAVCSLSWQPLDNHKQTVAYSGLEFQRSPENMSFDSYLWNTEISNTPEMTLNPVCLEYSPRDVHILVGGGYNGQIGFWDTRCGSRPVQMSAVLHSHRDPVYKVIWMPSLTCNESFSASTDGQVLFWDIRKTSEPTMRLVLDPSQKGNLYNAFGATSMEFEKTMKAKFMVGTEQGVVVSCRIPNLNQASKLETPNESIVATYHGHQGPISALQRNPFFRKNFLTVGDCTARIWSEDISTNTKFVRSFEQHPCTKRRQFGVLWI